MPEKNQVACRSCGWYTTHCTHPNTVEPNHEIHCIEDDHCYWKLNKPNKKCCRSCASYLFLCGSSWAHEDRGEADTYSCPTWHFEPIGLSSLRPKIIKGNINYDTVNEIYLLGTENEMFGLTTWSDILKDFKGHKVRITIQRDTGE
jgi:hypothetical protein